MKRALKILVVITILGLGYGGFRILASAKKAPEKKAVENRAKIVDIVDARRVTEPVTIEAMGTVIPSRTVTLFPEVGGKVVSQSQKLVPGGRFKAGERILKIDPRDYDLAIKQQKASVRKAQMDLATEQARKQVAAREWDLIRDEVQPTEEGRKLALREIQLETAEAAVSSAESGLNKAKLTRARTVVKAPFNAVVTEEFVDKGQVLSPGSRIATLVDADRFWVRVSVPVDRLPWISIPGIDGATEGSGATVTHEISDDVQVVREGRVIKLLGDLDAKGKMARLLIEVNDPLGDEEGDDGLPLFMGAFVKARVQGPVLEDVIEIPRRALREGDRVWVKRDDQLKILPVEVIWISGDQVFLKSDMESGAEVVTSFLSAPVDGMKLALESDVIDEMGDEEKPAGATQVGPAKNVQAQK